MLDITDSDVYAALTGFFGMIVPQGTPIVRGQQNRVPMPSVPCVVMTTLGAPRRIGTNADRIEAVMTTFTADSSITVDSSVSADAIAGFIASVEADFEYSIQADFYSPDAESWAMAVELLWRGNIGWNAMPKGIKPLYSDGRQQLPLVSGENQWVQRWTMTLVLDYQPTWTQATQAATKATVVPEPIDVFFPVVPGVVFTADSDITADSDLTI